MPVVVFAAARNHKACRYWKVGVNYICDRVLPFFCNEVPASSAKVFPCMKAYIACSNAPRPLYAAVRAMKFTESAHLSSEAVETVLFNFHSMDNSVRDTKHKKTTQITHSVAFARKYSNNQPSSNLRFESVRFLCTTCFISSRFDSKIIMIRFDTMTFGEASVLPPKVTSQLSRTT